MLLNARVILILFELSATFFTWFPEHFSSLVSAGFFPFFSTSKNYSASVPSLWACSLSKLYPFGLIQSHSCKHHLFANKPQIYVFSADPLQIPERSLFGCLTGISNSEFSETNSWFLVHLPLQHDTYTHHLLLPPPPCMSFGQDENVVLLVATFKPISKSS